MSQVDQPVSQERRQFIGTAAAVAGLTIAPGVLLYEVAHSKPDELAVSNRNRWGMLVDSTKCATGCNDCVTACSTENGWTLPEQTKNPRQAPQWIRKLELEDPLDRKSTRLNSSHRP